MFCFALNTQKGCDLTNCFTSFRDSLHSRDMTKKFLKHLHKGKRNSKFWIKNWFKRKLKRERVIATKSILGTSIYNVLKRGIKQTNVVNCNFNKYRNLRRGKLVVNVINITFHQLRFPCNFVVYINVLQKKNLQCVIMFSGIKISISTNLLSKEEYFLASFLFTAGTFSTYLFN